MEKVSASLFFTVLWRGLCQAVRWFLELFGFKKEGRYAKCVWGMFATSAAVIVTILAVMLMWTIGETVYEKHYKEAHCYNPDCSYSNYISENVYYHDLDDGKGYIFNCLTGEKTVRNIQWIARPEDGDSLFCFSNGKKRGYFNKYTGKVVIEPKYNHAWIFSEGLASVEEGGHIKFIDGTGKVVIDKKIAYKPNAEGYVFHGGYCIVKLDDNEFYGLMDKTGKMVLPQEYHSIEADRNYDLWSIRKGNKMAILDKELKPIIPLTECTIYLGDETINVTMPDYTLRKYDKEGQLINDFYISSVRMLEYEKEEIAYRIKTHDEEGNEYSVPVTESYHPIATARLRAYVAGYNHEGLMTADGHIVTKPLYYEIQALGNNLYLCTCTDYDKVIVNERGEVVK